jgi:hypothetical protein
MSTHKCPVPVCTTEVVNHLLMCNPHWRKVPRELQRKVYAAWGSYNRGLVEGAPMRRMGELIREYNAVRDQAVATVEAKLT